ncbi:MAG: FliG C-terminal domain-containing protein [Pseudomonadota bacterium]
MTAVVIAERRAAPAGLDKSARLMQALGARSAAIWSELTPDEADELSQAMARLDDGTPNAAAAGAFLEAQGPEPASRTEPPSAWDRLSALDAAALARLLAGESAEVVAVILAHLDPAAAARALRLMPSERAMAGLTRLLALQSPRPSAVAALEAALRARLDELGSEAPDPGQTRVARIFDQLDSRSENTFLAALDNAEPGAGGRVRALMFTFEDLAALDPAGLQTLLAAVDRSQLALALKAARPRTLDAFFRNMTARARDALKEDMAALGAVRRADVEAARSELAALARRLIECGDIRPSGDLADDLVE